MLATFPHQSRSDEALIVQMHQTERTAILAVEAAIFHVDHCQARPIEIGTFSASKRYPTAVVSTIGSPTAGARPVLAKIAEFLERETPP